MNEDVKCLQEQIDNDMAVLDGLYEKLKHLPETYDNRYENGIAERIRDVARRIEALQRSIRFRRDIIDSIETGA